MRNALLFTISVFLFSACVSQKKYTALQNQNKLLADEKTAVEEVLNKLAVENDSIKRENTSLDSLIRIEKARNEALAGKKDTKDPVVKTTPKYKKSTLTKEQEYDKKALFIYNFTSYVSWPKFKGNEFLIGVVGDSPINSFIASYTNGKSSSKAPIVVEKYVPSRNYQIIFIANSGAKNFGKIKKEFNGKSTLFVTENPLFDKTGAHISFYIDGDKVNFTVNKPAIEKAGLNVSSKLINFSQSQ
ncbi:MAG: hypothetical protein K0S33_3964 [Bacteroidetes bacterium]|jgi:hypothetical protein|nr:hypothetical protein [Bacteroidota bacterium]